LNGTNEQDTENQTVTQEEFDTLILALQKGKDELEAEKARTETAVVLHQKDKQGLTQRVASLEAEVQTKGDEAVTLRAETEQAKEQAQTQAGQVDTLTQERDAAIGEYRALVVASNSVFSDNLIQGATIDEIKQSAEHAATLVGKVKESLESQAQALAELTTVPAGSPQRQAADLSAMSTREKINHGLREAQKGG